MNDKLEKWMLPVMFILLPFGIVTTGLIWKSQQLFFLMIPLFVVAASIKNLWVKAFLIYGGLWQIAIFIFYFGNPGGPGPGPGLSVTICLMTGAIVYKWVSEGSLPTKKWYTVLRLVVLLQIGIGVFQFFGLNPVAKLFSYVTQVREFTPTHLVGSIGNRNYLASFVGMTLPLWIVWRRGIFLPLIAFIIILCPSPASLAVIIGGCFYFAYTRYGTIGKILAWSSFGLMVSVGFTAIYVFATGHHLWEFQSLPGQIQEFWNKGAIPMDQFRGDLGRFGMWLTALSLLIKTVPGMILGFGPGAYWGREYPLHSNYMIVWFYFGLVGMFFLIMYIRSTWRFLWSSKNAVLLTAFLVICLESFGNHSFEIATTAAMGIVFLGLIERERLKDG